MIMCHVGNHPHKGCLPCEDAQQQHVSVNTTWTQGLEAGAEESTQLSQNQNANGSAHAAWQHFSVMQSVTGVGGTSEKHYQETPVHPNAGVGILLKTLAVVDADSAEEVTRWETEWPVLHSVPMETTSKGAHYYFRRTALCNELGLTNGPLNKQADFKSIIGTGTAGTATEIQDKIWKADLLCLRSVH